MVDDGRVAEGAYTRSTMERASSSGALHRPSRGEIPRHSTAFTWDYHPASERSKAQWNRRKMLSVSRHSLVSKHRAPKRLLFACVCTKSKLREGVSLDSRELGNLQVGTIVVLMDERTLPDGVVRSWVGRESQPLGINVEPMGWITSFKPGPDGETGQSSLERALDDETIESLASRIIQRHMESKDAVVEVPKVGPGNWLTIDALGQHAAEQRRLARKREEKVFDQCEERVGILLVELDVNFEDEVPRRCDAIGVGESLDRSQFRSLVRGLKSPAGVITQDIGSDADLDQIFRSFDIDGGGSMDRRELAAAFSKIKVAHMRPKYTKAAGKIHAQRAAAAALDDAAERMRQSETLDAEYAPYEQGTRVNVRLGQLLNKRKVKSRDLRPLWDKNGDGKFDPGEITKNLDEFGFERTREEDEELFDILDADGDGTITIKELEEAMGEMIVEAKNYSILVSDTKNKAMAAREAAEQAQMAAVAMMAVG